MSNGAPLFHRFAEQIKHEISAGTYPVGTILPSIARFQQSSGLSRNTVAAALRLLMDEGVIARGGATRHGYKVVKNTRPRASQSTQSEAGGVALVLPFDYWNYVGAQLVGAVEAVLSRYSLNLILKNHKNSHELEAQILESLLEQSREAISGVILVTTDSFGNPNSALIRKISTKMPLLLMDRFVEGIDASYVGLDNRRVGREAARLLIDHGHTRIGYIDGFGRISPLADRRHGFHELANERSLRIQEKDVVVMPSEFESVQSMDEMATTLDSVLDLSSQGPTAYFCGDDKTAMELLKVLRLHKLRVPDDISIVGCDDDEFAHAAANRAFSSFRHPFSTMAEEALRLFNAERDDRTRPHVRLEVAAEFVDRSSVSPPRSAAG